MDKQQKKQMVANYNERTIIGGIYSITNTATGKIILLCDTDLNNAKNRFDFSQKTSTHPHKKLQDDFKKYGVNGFTFTVLEELKKKGEQTMDEFKEDLNLLYEIWQEKLKDKDMY